MNRRYMNLLLFVLYAAFIGIGVFIESPEMTRLIKLVLTAGAATICFFVPMPKRLNIMSFVLGFMGLAYLETLSRYTLNDWFHLVYFIPLVKAYFELKPKAFAGISIAMLFCTGWKYLSLMMLQHGTPSYGQGALLMVMGAFAAVILYQALRIQEERNETLALNEKLNQTLTQLEQLTLHKERTRVSRELHDSLGHALTALVMKLELTRHFKVTHPDQSGQYLNEAIEEGRSAIRQVRNVVQAMQEPRRSNDDLEILLDNTAPHGQLTLKTHFDWNLNELSSTAAHAGYRAVQEALTNTLRHGNAHCFTLVLKRETDCFLVLMSDDGQANAPIELGFGLKNMSERIREVGGSISFDAHEGFHIRIEFPLHRVDECVLKEE